MLLGIDHRSLTTGQAMVLPLFLDSSDDPRSPSNANTATTPRRGWWLQLWEMGWQFPYGLPTILDDAHTLITGTATAWPSVMKPTVSDARDSLTDGGRASMNFP